MNCITEQTAPCGADIVNGEAANNKWDLLELAEFEQSSLSADRRGKVSSEQEVHLWQSQKKSDTLLITWLNFTLLSVSICRIVLSKQMQMQETSATDNNDLHNTSFTIGYIHKKRRWPLKTQDHNFKTQINSFYNEDQLSKSTNLEAKTSHTGVMCVQLSPSAYWPAKHFCYCCWNTTNNTRKPETLLTHWICNKY